MLTNRSIALSVIVVDTYAGRPVIRVYRSRIYVCVVKTILNKLKSICTRLKWCRPVDDEVFKGFASDANADTANLLTTHFKLDLARMIYEDAIVPVRDVEGHTFVCLFTGCTTVLIPYAD